MPHSVNKHLNKVGKPQGKTNFNVLLLFQRQTYYSFCWLYSTVYATVISSLTQRNEGARPFIDELELPLSDICGKKKL